MTRPQPQPQPTPVAVEIARLAALLTWAARVDQAAQHQTTHQPHPSEGRQP